MVVCKFYQAGNCRNGDRCRFDHISANNMPSNRFAPLQNSGNLRDSNSITGNTSAVAGITGIDKVTLINDLSKERPQWILSCYSPGKNAPEQLFGGPLREQSFEEMRLKSYISPNPQQTAQEFQTLISESEQQIQAALNDLDGAIKFLADAQHKHPNRNDIITAISSTGKLADPLDPILNTTSAPSAGAFGAPQNNNVFGGGGGGGGGFGNPAFGAPSVPVSTGAFGQPSSLGAKPNLFAAGGSPAFGQPSSLGGGGAFGQASSLGPKPSPFAATSAAPSGFAGFVNVGQNQNGFPTSNAASHFLQNTTSAFGQPPTGPASINGNVFGKPNTFGQPSPLVAPTGPSSNTNPFAKANTAFGQPVQPPPDQIPQQPTFGQPSQPAFGQPAGGVGQPSGGFGQPSGGFGQPSGTFGQPSQPQNSLTNRKALSVASNPFSNNQPSSQQSQTPFQTQTQPQPQQTRPPSSTNPYGPNAIHSHPPPATYSTRNASNQLTMFKGHQVHFNPSIKQYEFRYRDGSIGKVLFPDGPPGYYAVTEEKDEVYAGNEEVKRVYERLRENSAAGFEGGIMPLIAPKREWCLWDF